MHLSTQVFDNIRKWGNITVDISKVEATGEAIIALFKNGNTRDYVEVVINLNGGIEWSRWEFIGGEYQLTENKQLLHLEQIEEEAANFAS